MSVVELGHSPFNLRREVKKTPFGETMKNRLVLISLLLMIFSFFSIQADEEIVLDPKINVAETTTYIGNSFSLLISVSEFESIGVFGFDVFYDQEVFTLTSHINQSLSQGSLIDAGIVEQGHFNYSLVNSDGFTGQGGLIRLYFSVSPNATEGTYPIYLGVGESFDVDLNRINIKSNTGKVTLEKRLETLPSLSLGTSVSTSQLEVGDTLIYQVQGYQLKNLGAASFEVYYDSELLELKSYRLDQDLSLSNNFFSVNDDFEGLLMFSMISLNGINSAYPLIEMTFEVIKDVTTATTIEFSSSELYNTELDVIQGMTLIRSLSIEKTVDATLLPKVKLPTKSVSSLKSETIDIMIDENSNLAAGNFEVVYNPFIVMVQSIDIPIETWQENGLLDYTHDEEAGIIRFSYLNANGLITEKTLMTITIESKYPDQVISTDFEITATETVNAALESIQLDTVNGTLTFNPTYIYRFLDLEDNLLKSFETSNLDESLIPIPPDKPGYLFAEWLITIEDNIKVYRPTYYILGDVNQDERLSIIDVTLIHQSLIGLIELSTLQKFAADLNQNQTAELADAIRLQLYLSGLIDSLHDNTN